MVSDAQTQTDDVSSLKLMTDSSCQTEFNPSDEDGIFYISLSLSLKKPIFHGDAQPAMFQCYFSVFKQVFFGWVRSS